MSSKYDGMYDNWYPKPVNFEVPDYRIYNKIDGIWQLEHTRDTLAKRGLKDPWMRNEIWRYPSYYEYGPVRAAANITFGEKCHGLKYGLLTAATIIIVKNLYWKWKFGKKPAYIHDFLDWLEEYRLSIGHSNL